MTTEQLRVMLLGGLSITLNDSSIEDFKSKKSPALLSYLIITGRPHARERLGALLWGESAEGRARANLRTVLWDLRQHLPDFISADRQTVSFDAEAPHWVDVEAFSAAVERVVGPQREGDSSETPLEGEQVEALESALSLYRGDFLAGFHISSAPDFESWVLRKREWARQLAIQGLHRLVVHYTGQRAYLSGIDAATRLLEIAPWQEETHRQLMRLLALNGQRGAALAQYESCCEMLNEELGVEPTMETRLLYNRIKSGKVLEVPDDATPPAQRVRVAGSPASRAYDGAFVGRDSEMTRLKQLLSSPDSGLTALVGARGVGKTRLAQEVAGQMADQMTDHLAEKGADTVGEGAWFIQLEGEDDPSQWCTPEALETSEAGEEGPEGPTWPGAILAIARALGLALTGGGPLEAQLADYLCHREVLLILDGPSGAGHAVAALTPLLHDVSPSRLLVVSEEDLDEVSAEMVRLEGLRLPSDEEEEAFLEADPGDLPGDGALALFLERARRADADLELDPYTMRRATQICRLTGGLPLAIELVAATVGSVSLDEAARRLDRCAGGGGEGTRSEPSGQRGLNAAATYAWDLLNTRRQAALAKLAVFEAAFDEDAAREIAGVGPGQLGSLVERAWLTRLGAGRYRIHRALRAFAGSKLKQLAWTGELRASSADGAGIRERHTAYYLGLVAKREGMLLGAGAKDASDEIERNWRNVRVAWRRAVADLQLDLLRESLRGVTDFLLLKGWLWEGEMLLDATLKAVSREAYASVRGLLPARLLMHRARLLNAQGRWGLVEGVAQGAVAWLPGGSDLSLAGRTLRAGALVEWGKALYLQGQLGAAKERLKQALSLVGDDRSPEIKARAFHHLGVMGLQRESYDEAEAYLTKALALYEALDHHPGRRAVRSDLGLLALRWRQYDRAETHLREALSMAQTMGDRRAESEAYTDLGRLASAQGDYERATIHCRKARRIARDLGDRSSEGKALTELGLLLLHQGDVQLAWKRSMLALEIAHALGDIASEARAWLVAGHVFSELDMLGQAAHAYSTALELQRKLGQSDLAAESLACLARVSLAQGDRSRARSLVEEVLERLDGCALPGANEPLRVYLTCYQVLTAVEDARAGEILGTLMQLYGEVDGGRLLPQAASDGLPVIGEDLRGA
jgi:DNA-binding SARP family transcriptional activator/tetratricopeptide (TPR) repeat protein